MLSGSLNQSSSVCVVWIVVYRMIWAAVCQLYCNLCQCPQCLQSCSLFTIVKWSVIGVSTHSTTQGSHLVSAYCHHCRQNLFLETGACGVPHSILGTVTDDHLDNGVSPHTKTW